MDWLRVDKSKATPMIRQIYSAIRQRILSGMLEAETRLPSSRELSNRLRISRNVVLEAYDLLAAEGFLQSRRGAGTYVAEGAAYERKVDINAPVVEKVTMGYEAGGGSINFRAGTPDLSMFPYLVWLRLLKKIFDNPPDDMLAYGHPEGRPELRQAICDYVVSHREVACHPDQIIVTAGTTQAIGIVCSLLKGVNNTMVLEDPITKDIRLIAQGLGFTPRGVEVDNDGMRTDLLPDDGDPACIYVTPSHQFPIGGTLPIQRRIELLQYAEKKNCYIIEDDYDSEFRFDGPPLSSLHGLSPGRVVYIGTFSKTLCPAIRVGYLILPAELINRGRSKKWRSDLHNEISSQLALAMFIREGYYLRHVNRMRNKYMRRREVLVKTLKAECSGRVEILGSATGLHLAARFEGVDFNQDMLKEIEIKGARFYPVATHSILPEQHKDKLLIGYGNVSCQQIVQGVRILADHL